MPTTSNPLDTSLSAVEMENEAKRQKMEEQEEAGGNRVEILEKVTCQITRDGEIQSFEVRGDLSITIGEEDAPSSPHLNLMVDEDLLEDMGLSFQANPKINKSVWDNEKNIVLKNTKKGYLPNKPLKAVRWRSNQPSVMEKFLNITCWTEEDGEESDCILLTLDYTLDDDSTISSIQTLLISFPTPHAASHQVISCDKGDVIQGVNMNSGEEDGNTVGVVWKILEVEAGESETLEMKIKVGGSGGENEVFPMSVQVIFNLFLFYVCD